MRTIEEVMKAFETAALNAGLARNTRKTYGPTIAEFAGMMKRGEITGVQDYLNHLASVKKISSNSVWHALNPLKFFYEKVLLKEFGEFDLPKRNRSKPMRSVLTMRQILGMMQTMPRVPRLQAGLLAGTGMRIESDMLTLRLKDVRIDDRVLTIYEAKGGKSRALRIPEFLVADLQGITQRVNPHALRHSYATGLLREGVDIKTIQEQLGHTSLETTQLYLHTAGKTTVDSPLDAEAARNIIPLRRTA